jgi:hypothetical protein
MHRHSTMTGVQPPTNQPRHTLPTRFKYSSSISSASSSRIIFSALKRSYRTLHGFERWKEQCQSGSSARKQQRVIWTAHHVQVMRRLPAMCSQDSAPTAAKSFPDFAKDIRMPTSHSVAILHELLNLHEAAVVGINGATQKLFAQGRSTNTGQSAHGIFFVWSGREDRDKISARAPTQRTCNGIDMSAAPTGTSPLGIRPC